MGHICYNSQGLYLDLESKIENKIGIVLSNKEMLEHLNKSSAAEYLKKNDRFPIRIEYSEYEFIYFELLKTLGYDLNPNHFFLMSNAIIKYAGTKYQELANETLKHFIEIQKTFTPESFNVCISKFIDEWYEKYGYIGLAISFSVVDHFCKKIVYSPLSNQKIIPFTYVVELTDLNKPLIPNKEVAQFDFDKRFITYLNTNFDKIDDIHWRNFELLAGQYFKDNGYDVIIKKGKKDGGVDLLVTDKDGQKTYIQCKRYASNIGIDIIKELTATIEHNKDGVKNGIAFCTHNVSFDAKEFVNEYAIEIKFKEREDIKRYLELESFKS